MEHDEIHEADVPEDVLIALGDVPISELVGTDHIESYEEASGTMSEGDEVIEAPQHDLQ